MLQLQLLLTNSPKIYYLYVFKDLILLDYFLEKIF